MSLGVKLYDRIASHSDLVVGVAARAQDGVPIPWSEVVEDVAKEVPLCDLAADRMMRSL